MTEIRLYNTRTRQKEAFVPIDPSNVRMYVCGPTVYDRAHIGNARPVVVFDVLYRLLRHVYGADHVTYARNFTDVDDKIIEKAVAVHSAGETLEDATRRVTNETIDWYHQDMDALGALRPDHEPRCTEFIEPMVKMTEELIVKGHAYAAKGHVLFAVESYDDYGRLSGRSVDDMIAGARVEVAPYKRNPMDFVIWKPSTDDQPGWDSPWGRGRPGWHIECSAMAREILGEVFDIHAGGIDLQFPHHENELAQSCCAHGVDRMANWWMHNEMLRVEGEKMSKSLGNFFTVNELREHLSGAVVRLVLLGTHYRSPLDWTTPRVEEAKSIMNRWLRLNDRFRRAGMELPERLRPDPLVVAALADDLNTPQAIRRLQELTSGVDADTDPTVLSTVIETIAFLGFRLGTTVGKDARKSIEEVLDGFERAGAILDAKAAELHEARMARDFQKADALREEMESLGVTVQSTKDGTTWERTIDFDPTKLEALK